MSRVLATLLGITAAVGVSAAFFIGTNKLFDQAAKRWPLFGALATGGATVGLFALLWGNGFLDQPVPATLIAAAVGAGLGTVVASTADPRRRLAVGAGGGAVLGLVGGLFLTGDAHPNLWFPNILSAIAVSLVTGAVVWAIRGRSGSLLRHGLFWVTFGWLVGAFLMATLGRGTRAEAIVATTVLGLGAGAWLGTVRATDATLGRRMSESSRTYIFLLPALLFIAMTLVIPLIKTIWLGFLTGGPRVFEFTGLGNYRGIFTDPAFIDAGNWTSIVSSRLFAAAVILTGIGILAGILAGRQRSARFVTEVVSLGPIAIGAILFGFAVFAAIRGTISNNLWWVFAVTIFATAAGLRCARRPQPG